jgi:hypothetical protein
LFYLEQVMTDLFSVKLILQHFKYFCCQIFCTGLMLDQLFNGKFATNDLIMTLSAYSYNILRWIGLIGLLGDNSPVRHSAKRRRIKTVMQELMYLAARLIRTGRRLKLRFSAACAGFTAFEATYAKLAAGYPTSHQIKAGGACRRRRSLAGSKQIRPMRSIMTWKFPNTGI